MIFHNEMAKIVTLTTDWHKSDYYIGAVKATILAAYPDTVFVDISHNIEQYNWQQAGFILRSLVDEFASDTIHIIGAGSEPGNGEKIVIAKYHEQYFIGTDNGTLGIIFGEKPEQVIAIDVGYNNEDCCFVEKSVFAEIAKFIIAGKDINQLGEIHDDVMRYTEAIPQVSERGITGRVIYIDSYGNAITNISKDLFDSVIADKNFEILINSYQHKTNKISMSYKDVNPTDIVCIFNSIGMLEIAMREANAKNLLGLRSNSMIRIDIK